LDEASAEIDVVTLLVFIAKQDNVNDARDDVGVDVKASLLQRPASALLINCYDPHWLKVHKPELDLQRLGSFVQRLVVGVQVVHDRNDFAVASL